MGKREFENEKKKKKIEKGKWKSRTNLLLTLNLSLALSISSMPMNEVFLHSNCYVWHCDKGRSILHWATMVGSFSTIKSYIQDGKFFVDKSRTVS